MFYVGLRTTTRRQNKVEERRWVLVISFRFSDLKAKVRRWTSQDVEKLHKIFK